MEHKSNDARERYGAACDNEIKTVSDGYRIVQGYRIPLPESGYDGPSESPLGVAVDIGTTTIAMELVDRVTGTILSGLSLLNSQRRWGSDVISRIRAANAGALELLGQAVRRDLLNGITQLVQAASVDGSRVGTVAIAANTTMIHLLLGFSCAALAQHPFTPEQTDFAEVPFYDLFDTDLSVYLPASGCRVVCLPALSAFIGGDVMGGVAVCNLVPDAAVPVALPVQETVPRLFIDLGTNAEMVLSAGGRHYCASAAAGPAFEGGKISCGTGCIPGAVSSVRVEGSRFGFDTIPGGDPGQLAGICGSGILDFTAAALQSGLIRRDGSLVPVCADGGIRLDGAGQITLTQQDVREIQLAKAAVRAGISVLLETAGLREEAVSSIILAGGFGLYLREESALETGLLPAAFAGKIFAPGNTALAAATACLLDGGFADRCRELIGSAETVVLAGYPGFEKAYISMIDF